MLASRCEHAFSTRDIKGHSPSILYISASLKFHKMCNGDYVESEFKFLMTCSVCSTLRVKFVCEINSFKVNFDCISKCDQFLFKSSQLILKFFYCSFDGIINNVSKHLHMN